jgi:uncharacterized protein YebE (UPF0316 family)
MPFADSGAYGLVVLPLLVFCARILDVSIGTLRIIFVSRFLKGWAALLGFFAGNYVGVLIEERIALGSLIIRIITRKDAAELVSHLWQAGYGVTSLPARGETGPVQLIFTVCRRRNLQEVITLIKRFNPRAFYTIEDVRFVQENVPGVARRRNIFSRLGMLVRK